MIVGRITVRQNVVWGHIGTPKSGKPREVPLSNDALAALKSHRHLRGPLVFCDVGGHMLTEGEVRHPLWRACKRAGTILMTMRYTHPAPEGARQAVQLLDVDADGQSLGRATAKSG